MTRSSSARATSVVGIEEFVQRCLRGEGLSREFVEQYVAERWAGDDFVVEVALDTAPYLAYATGSSVRRYSGAVDGVRHWPMYGRRGEPGCVLVSAPVDDEYVAWEQGMASRELRALNVPLHVHPCDHVAVVVGGTGILLLERRDGETRHLIEVAARPGLVALYPRGTAHTFVCGPEGILVASVQSRYEEPTEPRFATEASASYADLPVVPYQPLGC